MIGGAALGSLLVTAVGPGWGLAVDALTFVIAAVAFTGVRGAASLAKSTRTSINLDLREGWTHGDEGHGQLRSGRGGAGDVEPKACGVAGHGRAACSSACSASRGSWPPSLMSNCRMASNTCGPSKRSASSSDADGDMWWLNSPKPRPSSESSRSGQWPVSGCSARRRCHQASASSAGCGSRARCTPGRVCAVRTGPGSAHATRA